MVSLQNTSLVSILDGIVMGGGAGLSVHGRFRIATENTLFAMPECAIGLFPDVGMSHVLSRLPRGLGVYLGLTGARLKGADTVSAGIATHFIPSHMIPDFSTRLGTTSTASPSAINRVISEFAAPATVDAVPNADVIDECFGAGSATGFDDLTVENILERLGAAAKKQGSAAAFAEEALEMVLKGCPTSLKITLEAIKRCRKMDSVRDCLQNDFRLAVRCTRRADFYAGVKSAIVTKDRKPVWNPATLAEVSDETVQGFFAPLDDVNVNPFELHSTSSAGDDAGGLPRSRI
jgi:enoyl-CoA hydratase/carnithine racemase